MAMGNWKIKKMQKGQRGSQTRTKKARIVYVYPPEGGWKGGRPEENGFRKRG